MGPSLPGPSVVRLVKRRTFGGLGVRKAALHRANVAAVATATPRIASPKYRGLRLAFVGGTSPMSWLEEMTSLPICARGFALASAISPFAGVAQKSPSRRPFALSVASTLPEELSETSTLHTRRYPTVATVSMKRGSLTSSPSRRRSSQMQRVREPSVTAVSPPTEFSRSSFEINFLGVCSHTKRTRNAFRAPPHTLPP